MKSFMILLALMFPLGGQTAFAALAGFDTWVASTGSDLNPCTRTSPCATFARAYDMVGTGGTVHVVDSGGYGPLVIDHAVTIDGGGVATALTNAGSSADVPYFTVATVNALAVVTIENFTLTGNAPLSFLGAPPSAIRANAVGALHVQNCVFSSFTGPAIDFRAADADLEVRNVTIMDVPSNAGVYISNARALLEHVTIHHTQTGVIAAGASSVTITHSTLSANTTGVAAAYSPSAQVHVDDCVFATNQWAIVVSQGARAYLGRSSLFSSTLSALYNDGSSYIFSYGTNQFGGNMADGALSSTLTLK